MKTVGDYVSLIQSDLGDCEGDRYTSEKIAHMMGIVLCELWAISDDAPLKPVEVTISKQLTDVSGCCENIIKVDGIVDGNGNITKQLNTTEEKSKSRYTRASCSTDGNPNETIVLSGGYIRVDPPPTKQIKVRLWCKSPPSFSKNSDAINVPCKMELEWLRMVKAALTEVDDDSQSNNALGDRLMSRATGMVGAKNKMAEKAKKEA